ncbi:PREDICTED: carboxypeptidase B-like [Habropoda laboriosa]|uniref:carboxypeptidase B-like n=1 Tax=Habropoda laboriosa TaxID=597456 RepID=UPI00083E225F|nr:PREDICTED: carboxypeptidase B-like [Habropoda laboriosa]
MALDFRSILFLLLGLSVIIASNRTTARPKRGDLKILHGERYNCSSFEEGIREARYLSEDDVVSIETEDDPSIDDEGRGFSFMDVVESMFSAVANGIGSIMTSIIGTEKSFKSPSNRVSYRNYQLIRLFPSTKAQVNDLKELKEAEPEDVKFWTQPMYNKTTDLVVGPDLVSDVKTFLRNKGIDFTVLISDLQKTIAYQNPKMTKNQREDLVTSRGHSMTWKRYHRYGDIVRYLEYLALTYPKMVELIMIGHSFEGQPIKMIKISTGPNKEGETKPAIWIDAGMHAREWIGSAVATYIASQLVEKNTSYAKLLDNADWMILPVANPDGYEFTHIGDRLWRKTRSNHGEDQDDSRYSHSSFLQLVNHYARWLWGKCEGVDPNRNFGYHWGEVQEGGASLDPCHETYAGPYAFSEPETKAMADYILANKRNIRMYLTLHSYSQMWLVPWGYTYSRPSDYWELAKVAKKAIGAIAKVHGTDYQVGPSSDLMYPTSGASDDWAKGVAGIKYAYTLELRDRGTYGFLLPARQIVPTAREIWAGIRTIARLVTCNT